MEKIYNNKKIAKADVCLLLEGTYPYIKGGVSSWAHELIKNHSHLTFNIVSIMPKDYTAEVIAKLK